MGTPAHDLDAAQFEADLTNIDTLAAQYVRLATVSDKLNRSVIDGMSATNTDAVYHYRLESLGPERVATAYRAILQDTLELLMAESSHALQKRNTALEEFSRKYHVSIDSLLCYVNTDRSCEPHA
jgi:hypothetical protein